MNATATTVAPGGMMRLGMFVSFAIPGACLAGTCGPLIVNAIMASANFWLACFLLFLMVFGAELLLYGTQTIDEPLFLLVFLPMPVLISLGFHLGYLGMDIGFPITVAGVAMPPIMYVRVNRYYRKRQLAVSLHSSPS